MNAKYIAVQAGVRYWEDAVINGDEDTEGNKVPFRDGRFWRPVIRLEDGTITDWPIGMTADIYYKVCDDGEYWLLNEDGDRVAKWKCYYVPNDFLCHGDEGFGDYIIFKVQANGMIAGWHKPEIDKENWEPILED